MSETLRDKSEMPNPDGHEPKRIPVNQEFLAFEIRSLLQADILSPGLIQALETKRVASYGSYGEGPKEVTVEYHGRTFTFEKSRERVAYYVRISGPSREEISHSLEDELMVEYLDRVFSEDIPERVKQLLQNPAERKVRTENYGEDKIISVRIEGREYAFARTRAEYSSWEMRIIDLATDQVKNSVEIREEPEVEFLEKIDQETPGEV